MTRPWPQGGGCAEVDAATRMPAEIFEPENKAALQAYIKVTLNEYAGSGALAVGRCVDFGYTQCVGIASLLSIFGGAPPGAPPGAPLLGGIRMSADVRLGEGLAAQKATTPMPHHLGGDAGDDTQALGRDGRSSPEGPGV